MRCYELAPNVDRVHPGSPASDADGRKSSITEVGAGVRLLSETQVKAASGVDNLDTLLKMLQAGAVRVGTNATESILEEFRAR